MPEPVTPACPLWCVLEAGHGWTTRSRANPGTLLRAHESAQVGRVDQLDQDQLVVLLGQVETISEDAPELLLADEPRLVLLTGDDMVCLTATQARELAAVLSASADLLDSGPDPA